VSRGERGLAGLCSLMSSQTVGIRKAGKSFPQWQTALFLEQFSSQAKTDNSVITWCGPGFTMTMGNARRWPRNTVLHERTRMAVHLTAAEDVMLSTGPRFVVLITLEGLELRVDK
jgi:hypothetical protein